MFNRKQKKRTVSSRGWHRMPVYETLEAKQMLAADFGYGQNIIEDPFSNDAVTYKQIVQKAATQPYVKQELVVAIKTNNRVAEAGLTKLNWAALTGDTGAKVQQTLAHSQRGNGERVTLVRIGLSKSSDLFNVMRTLDARSEVMWSTPNFVYEGDPRELIPNDPQYPQQWHHTRMQNNLAWDTTLGTSSIIVAVTDDGVELNHSDLNANIWRNDDPIDGLDNDGNGFIDDLNGWDFNSNNNNPNPQSPSDDHGTHVSGIAAGRTNNGIGIAGVAGNATIMPIQFYGDNAWTAAMVNGAFKYATDNGAKIVNTSYNVDGFVNDPVFLAGLNYLYDRGVLHFNSAGNNSQLNPARQALTQTLLVASTEQNDTKSGFSNYGIGVDIAAPGNPILSTLTSNGYGELGGTSMAAPAAAGAAALIWSANPSWTRDQVAAQIYATADNIDAQNPSLIGLLGGGRVNSFKAVTQTIAAPKVRLVNNLPANGGTLDNLTINNFDLAFNQIMDPAAMNNMANFELRGAGPDRLFSTSDDIVYTLSAPTYRIGTNLTKFQIAEGNLPYGKYRLTIFSGGVQNPFGTDLDGDGNGTGGDNFVSEFTLSPPYRGSVTFSKENYKPVDLTQFRVSDANAVNPIAVTVTTSGGDQENATLTDEGNFSWVGAMPTLAGTPTVGNGKLEVFLGQTITVTYLDLNDGSGNSYTATDTAVISNIIKYTSADVPKTIADNSTVTSVINITDAGVIADLDLQLDITHTFVGDLRAALIAPDGTRISLFSNIGSSGDNFRNTVFDDEASTPISSGSAPYTGSFRPTESFSVLDSKPITGVWTLEIRDTASGDVGTLNNWSLSVDVRSLDTGIMTLNKAEYGVSDTLAITVQDSNHTGPMTVLVTTNGGESETVTLTQTGASVYTGSINTVAGAPNNNNGQLNVRPGQTISVKYRDLDIGNGTPADVIKTAPVTNVIEYRSADIPKTIGDLATTRSTIQISDPGSIRDLDVLLNIRHTYDADLDVFLVAPDGTRVELFTDVGGAGDNFTQTRLDDEAPTAITAGTAPFTGRFRPEGSLATLDNKVITGTWTLEITDDAQTDTGTLDGWSLFIDVIPPVVVPNINVSGPSSVTEGNADTQNVTFTVALSEPTTEEVRVDYATKTAGYSVPATSGADFNAVLGTLIFAPGETSKTVTVQVLGNRVVELNESFGLELSNAVKGTLGTALANLQIVDNDSWTYAGLVDFGTDTSPVANGQIGVGLLPYTASKGLGWTNMTNVSIVDRGVGDAVVRDIALASSASFAFDVPNGPMIVRVTFGDQTKAHDQMRVTTEGIVQPVVSTQAGQIVARLFRVNVTDGQLNLDFQDMGGADPQVAIAGLGFGRR
jgi:subtilisin family serine protease/subtilisin-like proprotein convertase family protein